MQPKAVPKKSGAKIVKKKTSIKPKGEDSSKAVKQSNSNVSLSKSSRKIIKSKTGAPPKIDRSSSSDSLDSSEFQRETRDIKFQILESLQLFKATTQEYLDQNGVLEQEVDQFESEFRQVRTEVSEILMESSKSKQDLFEIRKKMQTSLSRGEYSPKQLIFEQSLNLEQSVQDRDRKRNLVKKVEGIKKEIREIKEIMVNNEEEVRESEAENTELRNITLKLRENLACEPLVIEDSGEKLGCTVCLLF